MGCILGLIAFFFPRVVIAVLALFTAYLSTAYQTVLWPVLGFFFAPFTTLAYALAINQVGRLDGVYLVVFIFAVLLDLGVIGGARRSRKKK